MLVQQSANKPKLAIFLTDSIANKEITNIFLDRDRGADQQTRAADEDSL